VCLLYIKVLLHQTWGFGVLGILIANNEYEFVEKIIQLLNDEHLQNSFKINARTFVEENYSWDKANRILENVLLK
jgi:glycosyltransferase involved in cell wall biosynthesis